MAWRATLSAMALGLAASVCAAGDAHEHEHGAARSPERAALIARAEQALAEGQVAEALKAFEHSADLEHASDIEQGLVRTYMQAGDYRRAMAFAAHTAGAHGEDVGGAALYAWLLNLGGQGAFARQLLERVEARVPGQALIAQTVSQLRSPWPVARGALLAVPTRMAPYGVPGALPAGLGVAGSGVLIDDGRHALVPAGIVASSYQTVWVRNGLGHTVEAQVVRRFETQGLVLLKLASPLSAGRSWPRAPRDAFPGSPAYTLEYAATPDAAPAWPMLRLGFLGGASLDPGQRRLGIEVPAGPRGGPVMDAGGHLVGMAVPSLSGKDEGDAFVPMSTLTPLLGDLLGPPPSAAPAAGRMPVDEVYELALPMTLQVLVPRP